MSTAKPYSLGFNGHAKSCDCNACAKARAKHTVELWEQNGSFATPKTADSTVFVKSYFRRQPNHLQRRPNARRELRAFIRALRKATR